LRFLALKWSAEEFSGSFVKTMDNFMASNKEAKDQLIRKFELSFETAITRCAKLWGKNAFRRPDGDGWRDQSLAGLYDAEMLAASNLSNSQFSALAEISNMVQKKTRRLFDDPDFDLAVRQGTNTPSRLALRTEYMHSMLVDLAGG
jgi:hypothetical protein